MIMHSATTIADHTARFVDMMSLRDLSRGRVRIASEVSGLKSEIATLNHDHPGDPAIGYYINQLKRELRRCEHLLARVSVRLDTYNSAQSA